MSSEAGFDFDMLCRPIKMYVMVRNFFDMSVDTFSEAPICLWIYMRNKLLAHRPSFFMVVMSTPFRYMAMAPLACRLWEPTRFDNSP